MTNTHKDTTVGTVVRIAKGGFGFAEVKGEEKDTFIPQSLVSDHSLAPGMVVTMERIEGEKGYRAQSIILKGGSKSESAVSKDVTYSGTFKFWNGDKGFGFIENHNCSQIEGDIFLHITVTNKFGSVPEGGDEVTFKVGPGRRGLQVSEIVEVVSAQTTSTSRKRVESEESSHRNPKKEKKGKRSPGKNNRPFVKTAVENERFNGHRYPGM